MTVFLPLLLTGLALCLLCAFHLYLTCPHTGHNPMCRNELLYHYAHRGLHSASIPENSMAAFCRAAEHGYGIELDVRLTSDLHPVIFHDENALRMCGTNQRICDMTLHEVRALRLAGTDEKVPTLQEVLQAVKGRVPLLIELKPAAGKQGRQLLISRVLDSVKEYPGSICMESFDPRILYRLRKSNPDIPRGQLVMKGKDLRFFLLSRLLILFLSSFIFALELLISVLYRLALLVCLLLNLRLPAFFPLYLFLKVRQVRISCLHCRISGFLLYHY